MNWKKPTFSVALTAIGLTCVNQVAALLPFEPSKIALNVPTVAGFAGTWEFYIPCHLESGAYVWRAQPDGQLVGQDGFRTPVPPRAREGGKLRIAFLGGSTSQGGFRDFPTTTGEILNASGIPTEIVNAGCSSYSTHQCAEIMQRVVADYRPDIVFVYEGWNDQGVTDGYSDLEKSRAVRGVGLSCIPRGLSKLCGWLNQKMHRDRPRCTPEEMEENYKRIQTVCDSIGAKLVVATRPLAANPPSQGWGGKSQAYWQRRLNTTNPIVEYAGIQSVYAAVQKNQSIVFDLASEVKKIETAGERAGITVYSPDACHVSPWANRKIAECLARYFSGESETVARVLRSDDYKSACARQFLSDFEPHAAVAYGACVPLEILERKKRFEEARWGGSETNAKVKLTTLAGLASEMNCDAGVLLQMMRVAIYSGSASNGIDALGSVRIETDSERSRVNEVLARLKQSM